MLHSGKYYNAILKKPDTLLSIYKKMIVFNTAANVRNQLQIFL